MKGAGGSLSKGLDNSDNNNKINKENNKEGDNNGRQQQSNREKQSEERRKRIREALARIREIGGGVDGGGHDGNVSVFDKRRGGKGLANGLVDYHIETPDKIKSIFEGAGISTPSYNKLKLNNQQSIDTFKKAIAKAKQSLGNDGASVELKDDYKDINLYLSEDGESGFGIKPNGDIVSVFSSKKVKGRAHHLLEIAVYEGGGRQLDCFDIYLTKIYETHGFKPVAKMKWDDEYIPEGWNKENFKDYNNGEPDVVFMVYDPNTKKDNEIPYIVDYDDGDKIQQKYFAKNKVDSLIDAKKKEFKGSDVNRDADGKFATQNAGRRQKNSSSNKSKDKRENDKSKDNSNPKKSNCNVGDIINATIGDNNYTIPIKKLAESNNYELYQFNNGDFSNLKPKNYKNIEDAIKNVSERYNELFNIYGMSDNQPTKKLKVIMLGKEYKKSLKTTAGFVWRKGREEEDNNSIVMNANILKGYNVSEIEDAIIHETVHTIVNDNIRNKKMDNNITTILNEALAESGIIAMTGKNYREPVFYKGSLFNPKQKERMDINEVSAIEKINYLFRSKYNFVCNLMYEIYLRNNKNSDIFKDMINEAIEGNKQTLSSVLESVGSKIGLEGNIDDILKTIAKKSYGANDKQAEIFTEMYHQEEKIWNR